MHQRALCFALGMSLVVAGTFLLAPAPCCYARQVVMRGTGPTLVPPFVTAATVTRIADPKLLGGDVRVSYRLAPGPRPYDVTISILSRPTGDAVAVVWQGSEYGSPAGQEHFWAGRDGNGRYVDPGQYTVRVAARDLAARECRVDLPLDLVRLGIRSIAANSSAGAGVNEWQTVYFRKSGAYSYYATPGTGEYLSSAETGETSDLDLDDGSPRPAPQMYTRTDEPALEPGGAYEDDSFNYPLCYLAGAVPDVTVAFGSTCTLADGTQGACNYPVPGFEIRSVAQDEQGSWSTGQTSISPGGSENLQGPALPLVAGRTERHVEWAYEYRPLATPDWIRIPGSHTTGHRFYTILDHPYWAAGASGTQYTGPWVEVLEYLATFASALGIDCVDKSRVVEALIKGFFGQNGPLTTAIEDVHYDCPGEGGDGGATHYFNWSTWTSRLSRLLNAHANGKFVNCTDCATSTSTMLSMLGVANIKLVDTGSMTLRAIWGIGTDDYTLDLWHNGGGSGHGFSYHHFITRDDGTHMSDACLWVDEDGNPDQLPGTPGYNHDRLMSSYKALVSKGGFTWVTEALPKID